MEPATQPASPSACIFHPDRAPDITHPDLCVDCHADPGARAVSEQIYWSDYEARFGPRRAAREHCAQCADPGDRTSHRGSELCRMRSSIASGGTEAHCACAACF